MMSTPAVRLGVVALFAGVVVSSGCGRAAHGAAAPQDPAIAVRIADVENASVAAVVTGTGTLGAKDEIPLAFKIGGVVANVLVDEGARVRAGQRLAALDLREIDAMVDKATVGVEKARRDAARAERLYKDSVATLSQMQDARSALDAAKADLEAAKVNREYAVISAPNDGIILKRSANPGAQVAPGTQIVLFGSASRGTVLRVGLADRDAVRVHDGDAATIEFDAFGSREFSGRVRQVGASADARTGTYVVEIAVAGGERLPSGLVGRARIAARATAANRAADADVLAIPAEALVEGDGSSGVVFTLDRATHRARRHAVSLVGVSGDRVLVRGLDGAAPVITSGAAWLSDSARVDVKSEARQ